MLLFVFSANETDKESKDQEKDSDGDYDYEDDDDGDESAWWPADLYQKWGWSWMRQISLKHKDNEWTWRIQ